MRLAPVCQLDLAYDDHGVRTVRPFRGDEGTGYGAGTGRATGDRLSGLVRWSNQPHRRSDGVLLPDIRGVVETAGAGSVVFHLAGRIDWRSEPDGIRTGIELLSGSFAAEDDEHRWLNDVLCVAEGMIDPATLTLRLAVSYCINELADEQIRREGHVT